MLREQGGGRLEEMATLGCKHLWRAEAQSDSVEKLRFRSLYSAQTQTASWGCEKVVCEPPQRTQTVFQHHAGGVSTVILGTPVSKWVSRSPMKQLGQDPTEQITGSCQMRQAGISSVQPRVILMQEAAKPSVLRGDAETQVL